MDNFKRGFFLKQYVKQYVRPLGSHVLYVGPRASRDGRFILKFPKWIVGKAKQTDPRHFMYEQQWGSKARKPRPVCCYPDCIAGECLRPEPPRRPRGLRAAQEIAAFELLQVGHSKRKIARLLRVNRET